MGEKAPNNNPDPHIRHAGLDPHGEMRVTDEFTIAARGDNVEIRQARTARVKTVPQHEFADALKEKWFGEY